jgi:hypothetical protein
MLKSDVVRIFGSISAIARAIDITPEAVVQWPDILPKRLQDRVIAAAVRENKLDDVLKLTA